MHSQSFIILFPFDNSEKTFAPILPMKNNFKGLTKGINIMLYTLPDFSVAKLILSICFKLQITSLFPDYLIKYFSTSTHLKVSHSKQRKEGEWY